MDNETMSNIPFDRGLFWKVLPAVYVLVIIVWVLVVNLSEYKIKSQDYGGSFLASTIFAYLIHLWLLPGEYEEYEEYDDDEQEQEHEGHAE